MRTVALPALPAAAMGYALSLTAHADVAVTGDVNPNPNDNTDQVLWELPSDLIIGDTLEGDVSVDSTGNTTAVDLNGFDVFIGRQNPVGLAFGDGTLSVSDTGVTFGNMGSDVFVGVDGSGIFDVDTEASVTVDNITVGQNAGSVGLAVFSSNAEVYVDTDVEVGVSSNTADLRVDSGAELTINDDLFIGVNNVGSGDLEIHSNGSISIGDDLQVGVDGTGDFTITSGGDLQADGISYLGRNAGSAGTMSADGDGSTVDGFALFVGGHGQGSLTLTNNASANLNFFGVGMGNTAATGFNETDINTTGSAVVSNDAMLSFGNGAVGGNVVGTLDITTGGNVFVRNTLAIGDQSEGVGTVTVTGDDSDLTVTSTTDGPDFGLVVGGAGSGTLNVLSEGSVFVNDTDLLVGFGTSSGMFGPQVDNSNGAGTININDGLAAVVQGDTYIGVDGTGEVNATNGSAFFTWNGSTTVGFGADGEGTFNASDEDTIVFLGGNLTVGEHGTGTVNVDNSARFISGVEVLPGPGNVVVTSIGGNDTGVGTFNVTNNASATFFQTLHVGDEGTGTLNVNTQGNVAVMGNVNVGQIAGSLGTVNVNGNGSLMEVAGNVVVGNAGTGNMNITDGGNVTVSGDFLAVGMQSNATGVINVAGTESILFVNGNTAPNTDGDLGVGIAGTGELNITEGGNVFVSGNSFVGTDGGEGTINITGNGTVASPADFSVFFTEGEQYIGLDGTGTVNVNNAGFMYVDDDAFIGFESDGNGTLNVSNGGFAIFDESLNVAVESGSIGEVNVTNAFVFVSNDLTIGSNGTATVNVTEDSFLDVNDDLNVGIFNGSTGTLNISSNSFVDVSDDGYVGIDGTGIVNINTGGELEIEADLRIGVLSNGTGTVNVDGPGSRLEVNDDDDEFGLVVGQSGTGFLNITSGGEVDALDDFQVGFRDNSSGTVLVDGAGSTLFVDDDAAIGYDGTGQMTISNGGVVTIDDDLRIARNDDSTGNVIVTGVGSRLDVDDDLDVGDGGDGELAVFDSAAVTTRDLTIGEDTDSEGFVFADGGATIDVTNNVVVGQSGDAFFIATGGAELDVEGNVMVGQFGDANGNMFIANAFAQVDGDVVVGNSGGSQANVFVFDGGTLDVGTGADGSSVIVGNVAGSQGNVIVAGEGSSISTTGTVKPDFTVGRDGIGNVSIFDGGLIEARSLTVGQDIEGRGNVHVEGTGSLFDIEEDATIGQRGQANVFVSSQGALNVDGNVTLGEFTSGDGLLHISDDGVVTVLGTTTIGVEGDGVVVVEDGGSLVASNIGLDVNDQGSGLLVVGTDGTVDAENIVVGNMADSDATLELDGGTVTVTGTLTNYDIIQGTGLINGDVNQMNEVIGGDGATPLVFDNGRVTGNGSFAGLVHFDDIYDPGVDGFNDGIADVAHGDSVFTANSILVVDVTGNTGGEFDHITVAGGTLTRGGTIFVDVAGNAGIVEGDELEIITGAQTGNVADVDSTPVIGSEWVVVETGGTTVIRLDDYNFLDAAGNSGGNFNPQQLELLEGLDNADEEALGNDEDASEVYALIQDLIGEDPAAAAALLDTLDGASAAYLNALHTGAFSHRSISTLGRLGGSGLAFQPAADWENGRATALDFVADKASPNGSFWFEGGYSDLEQDDNSGVGTFGFDAQSYGITLGYERQWTENFAGGIAFGYDSIDADANGGLASSDTEAWSVIGYGRYNLGVDWLSNDTWYVDGTLGLSTNDIDTDRRVMGMTASGSTDALQWLAEGRLGFYHDFDETLAINPYLGIRYIGTSVDGYSESGAGGLNLQYGDSDSHSIQGYIGSELTKEMALQDGFVLTPRVRANYVFEIGSQDDAIVTNYVIDPTSTFNTFTLDLPDNYFSLGLGADLTKGSNWTIYADFDYANGSDMDQFDVTGGVRIDF